MTGTRDLRPSDVLNLIESFGTKMLNLNFSCRVNLLFRSTMNSVLNFDHTAQQAAI